MRSYQNELWFAAATSFSTTGRRERAVQRDRILECQAGARADREVAGAQRVSDQDSVTRGPVAVAEQRKVAPDRVVRDQRMTVEIGREHLLAVGTRLVVGHPVEAGAVPGGCVALDE